MTNPNAPQIDVTLITEPMRRERDRLLGDRDRLKAAAQDIRDRAAWEAQQRLDAGGQQADELERQAAGAAAYAAYWENLAVEQEERAALEAPDPLEGPGSTATDLPQVTR